MDNGVPWLAEDTTPVRYTCGAILVAPSYVITAGHCVSEDDILDPETTPVMLEMYPVEADLDWQSGIDLSTPEGQRNRAMTRVLGDVDECDDCVTSL